MYLKELFDEIIKKLERAKENDTRPQIVPYPGEYTITIPEGKTSYKIMIKKYQHGVTINTVAADKTQHQILLTEASLQDALRVVQAAIIIAYGKSLH